MCVCVCVCVTERHALQAGRCCHVMCVMIICRTITGEVPRSTLACMVHSPALLLGWPDVVAEQYGVCVCMCVFVCVAYGPDPDLGWRGRKPQARTTKEVSHIQHPHSTLMTSGHTHIHTHMYTRAHTHANTYEASIWA